MESKIKCGQIRKRKGRVYGRQDFSECRDGVFAENHGSCDDVLQALLVTLSGKSGTGQKHILEQFAAYVKAGGTIKAVRFDEEHLEDFMLLPGNLD